MTKKITDWAITATVTRPDGTWYAETITKIDNTTTSYVDDFLTDHIKEVNNVPSNNRRKVPRKSNKSKQSSQATV